MSLEDKFETFEVYTAATTPGSTCERAARPASDDLPLSPDNPAHSTSRGPDETACDCIPTSLPTFPCRPASSGGGGRIRTYEGVSRQIYSLLPLAAWVPLR